MPSLEAMASVMVELNLFYSDGIGDGGVKLILLHTFTMYNRTPSNDYLFDSLKIIVNARQRVYQKFKIVIRLPNIDAIASSDGIDDGGVIIF